MERRLAAILAADVAGYSRLMGADETGTLAALKALREELFDPKIAEHNGRIVKLMGDGALVEFASVVDAVQCAVEIQRGMAARNAETPDGRRVDLRVGINLGDVIVEGEDIYGDGVNVAARLEALAEPGGICISGDVYRQVHNKLALGFADLGEQEVKNIAEPVRVYRVLLDGESAPVAARPARRGVSAAQVIGSALVVLLIAAGAVAAWWRPWEPEVKPVSVEAMALPLPDKPSIAVLPFDNMSDDPGQAYFADGMTEDLITDLSKISGLFVIARNSSFAYKGKSPEVRAVARELGVRYVLEGSVRRAGDQVRINAQLIDATTGGHLWAERYDGTLADVFALQDRVTGQIVAALAVHLASGEHVRRGPGETDDPAAYDAFLQGWELYRRFTPDDFVAAIPHFERARELDPDYGRAHAALASVYFESWWRGYAWTDKVVPGDGDFVSWGASHEKAKQNLELALLHPTPLAHQVMSRISIDERQFDQAVAESDRAVSLDPNDPEGHLARGLALVSAGRAEEATAAAQHGLRLDPRHPWPNLYVLGIAHIQLGEYREALDALERAAKWPAHPGGVKAGLAIAHAYLGHGDEARAALKVYTDSWRWTPRVERVMTYWPFRREVDVRRIGGGLIKAGLCCEERLEEYIARVRLGGTLE